MSDKSKALRADNIKISLLVWKLHKAIERAKEQDILFNEVDDVTKLATDSFNIFLEHGVLDEKAHLHNPENSSPRSHSAGPDRRQNVDYTPVSECCYNWCERLAREQRDLLTTESIGFMNKYQGQKIDYVVSDNCLIHVKEFQKKIAVDTLTAVRKICHVKSVMQENLIHDNYIVKYIQRCSALCWMMQITDPPLCLKFDVKNNEDLDKTLYNAFTKNGSKIEYLVWPILFLHKSGPMLAKGVAQGT